VKYHNCYNKCYGNRFWLDLDSTLSNPEWYGPNLDLEHTI